MLQDKEVEVVRTKNRMDPDVDEHPIYAGYRDVSLNLRFRSEEAMMLGLDGHICELRLGLMSIASHYQVPPSPRSFPRGHCVWSLRSGPSLTSCDFFPYTRTKRRL